MNPPQVLRVAPIVEGHGEIEAVPTLLRRIWIEMLDRTLLDCVKPIRQPRLSLVAPDGAALDKAVGLARLKLNGPLSGAPAECTRILLLIDAEDDCPVELKARLLPRMHSIEPTALCVFPKRMFETWIIGGSGGLSGVFDPSATVPPAPEASGAAKSWVKDHLVDRSTYSETADQARLTAGINLGMCRDRCPSFDKLCRDLESITV